MQVETATDVAALRLRAEGISWTATHDGELVLLDHHAAKYVAANPSAARLWTLLADGTTRRDLEGALIADYGIDADVAHRDVDDFLTDLRARELLV